MEGGLEGRQQTADSRPQTADRRAPQQTAADIKLAALSTTRPIDVRSAPQGVSQLGCSGYSPPATTLPSTRPRLSLADPAHIRACDRLCGRRSHLAGAWQRLAYLSGKGCSSDATTPSPRAGPRCTPAPMRRAGAAQLCPPAAARALPDDDAAREPPRDRVGVYTHRQPG
jgi:hypothetical protein